MMKKRKIIAGLAACGLAAALALAAGHGTARAGDSPLPATQAGSTLVTASSPQPPYYMRYSDNRSWCIADPGDSQVDGTYAVMEHCVAGDPEQEIWFSRYIGGGSWWKISNDVNMCLVNPNGGGAGQLLEWVHCTDSLWSIWTYYLDVASHYIWADAQKPQLMIYVISHDPFQGQNLEAVAKQTNPRVIGAEMCVTDAIGNPLVC